MSKYKQKFCDKCKRSQIFYKGGCLTCKNARQNPKTSYGSFCAENKARFK